MPPEFAHAMMATMYRAQASVTLTATPATALSRQPRSAKQSVRLYCRVGEIAQGVRSSGESFLLSGPLLESFFAEARWSGVGSGNFAEWGEKSRAAVELFWRRYLHGQISFDELTGSIELESQTPVGKGFSSSSVDILAVLDLVRRRLRPQLSDESLYRIAASIEPTDPCLGQGDLTLFSQRRGRTLRRMAWPPYRLDWIDAAPQRRVSTLDSLCLWREISRSAALTRRYDSLYECALSAFVRRRPQELLALGRLSGDLLSEVVSRPGWEEFVSRLEVESDSRAGAACATKRYPFLAHTGTLFASVTATDRELTR